MMQSTDKNAARRARRAARKANAIVPAQLSPRRQRKGIYHLVNAETGRTLGQRSTGQPIVFKSRTDALAFIAELDAQLTELGK